MSETRRNPFETYRRQAQTLKVSGDTHDRIMGKIRELEQAEAETPSAEAARVATFTAIAKSGSATRGRERHHPWFSAPLKLAACLLLVVGVGLLALGALPGMPESVSLLTRSEQAVADPLLRPYQRLELSEPSLIVLDYDQHSNAFQKYDPTAQYRFGLEASLVLPGLSGEDVRVSLVGAPYVEICGPTMRDAEQLILPLRDANYHMTWGVRSFTICMPFQMTDAVQQQLFRGDGAGIYSADALYARKCAELIAGLRDAQLEVQSSQGVAAYRFSFANLPDLNTIQLEALHLGSYPISLELVEGDGAPPLRSAFMMGYAINESGQPYGTMEEFDSFDELPDLISVVATNGQEGYVYREDMGLAEGTMPSSPDEAVALMDDHNRRFKEGFIRALEEQGYAVDEADVDTMLSEMSNGDGLEAVEAAITKCAAKIRKLPDAPAGQKPPNIFEAIQAGEAASSTVITVYAEDGKTPIGEFEVGGI